MTRRLEPAWTFYGRQGCNCCQEAANLLLLLLDGKRVTVRMIDLASPLEAPAPIHRLPALMDQDGRVTWQGSFDSQATERAWRSLAEPRIHAAREADIGMTDPLPIANGEQWA